MAETIVIILHYCAVPRVAPAPKVMRGNGRGSARGAPPAKQRVGPNFYALFCISSLHHYNLVAMPLESVVRWYCNCFLRLSACQVVQHGSGTTLSVSARTWPNVARFCLVLHPTKSISAAHGPTDGNVVSLCGSVDLKLFREALTLDSQRIRTHVSSSRELQIPCPFAFNGVRHGMPHFSPLIALHRICSGPITNLDRATRVHRCT